MFLSHKFRCCLTEQMIFIAFKKRSSQIWRISTFEDRTLELISRFFTSKCKRKQQISPVHSVPWHQTFLESARARFALAPLSCDNAAKFLPVRLAFERIHSLLDFANTVVTAAFFEVLHLQDPKLQCSPLSRNRNASLTGYWTTVHQLFQIHPYL